MVVQDEVITKLKEVFDPEIPVNIWDLGLIYNVGIEDEKVTVRMTLTSQHCPAAQSLPELVRQRCLAIDGVDQVDVDVVWDPPWGPEKITAEGKKILGIEG